MRLITSCSSLELARFQCSGQIVEQVACLTRADHRPQPALEPAPRLCREQRLGSGSVVVLDRPATWLGARLHDHAVALLAQDLDVVADLTQPFSERLRQHVGTDLTLDGPEQDVLPQHMREALDQPGVHQRLQVRPSCSRSSVA